MCLASVGEGYDDGRFGTWAFGLSLIWNVIAFPFYLASEVLFSINDGNAIPMHFTVTAILGFSVIGAAELLWQRRKSRRPGATK